MTLTARRGRLIASLLVALGAADSAASQAPQPFFWWRSETVRTELGLTADQAARVDQIHQKTLPELRQDFAELDRLEAKLTHLIENAADEALVARQIDRVETARANLNKTRSLMLYRMRQVLTSEQQQRLKALHQRRAEQQRRSGGVGPSGKLPDSKPPGC